MKVAIIHYWLDGYRGGEKVLEAICELFPEADIYTHIYKSEEIPDSIKKHKIMTTFIQKLPFVLKFSRLYLPLMPLALLLLDLKKYDLIISSESGPAKCILKRRDALHICYCHTPMRYIWDMEKDYVRTSQFVVRWLWKIVACYMRVWDKWSAKQVDYFIANSKFVAARIRKFYRRRSVVINPPVEIDKFDPTKKRENFYLTVSQLVPYKKIDLLVNAFNKLGLNLLVIGNGFEFEKIRHEAGSSISIMGKVSDKILREKMETCKAFVFAGKEDFGIIFAEAQAAGAPVIAYRKGGVRDVVLNGKTGLFFKNQDIDSIIRAVKAFESGKIHFLPALEISKNVNSFSKKEFLNKFSNYVNLCLAHNNEQKRN